MAMRASHGPPLIRTYFGLGGHHIQFNVVSAETLREAQANPDAHRDLIVRVAGYSDYFCDISRALQDEIIERTEHQAAADGYGFVRPSAVSRMRVRKWSGRDS